MKIALLFVIGATFCVLALAQNENDEPSSTLTVDSTNQQTDPDNSDATDEESMNVEESRYYGGGWRGGRRGGWRRWG
ncbi:hypothetical protein quinque_003601 [Culex quinquefasciatus]